MFQYKHGVVAQMRRFFKAVSRGLWWENAERESCTEEFCRRFEEMGCSILGQEGKGKCL